MPISKPNLLLVIICSVMVIVLQGYGDTILPKLRYESTLFHTKEYWRLLSGHFVHLSWMHAFLNLVGVWMLAFIFDEIVKLTTLLISILFIAMGVSLGLFYLNPDIDWYVGLSGVLHGLIVFGALVSCRIKMWPSIALLAFLSIKLLWEQYLADPYSMETYISGQVIYDSHLYGVISGVVFTAALALVLLVFHRDGR